ERSWGTITASYCFLVQDHQPTMFSMEDMFDKGQCKTCDIYLLGKVLLMCNNIIQDAIEKLSSHAEPPVKVHWGIKWSFTEVVLHETLVFLSSDSCIHSLQLNHHVWIVEHIAPTKM
ncbi:unnamed protein product, partial [Prunus brigantina]